MPPLGPECIRLQQDGTKGNTSPRLRSLRAVKNVFKSQKVSALITYYDLADHETVEIHSSVEPPEVE